MSKISRLTALAVARTMLTGSPHAAGLAARMRACLDADAAWYLPLAERCARLPRALWLRQTPRTLASLIERDIGYQQAWLAEHPPRVRRYILRVRDRMQPLPVGLLDRCQVPYWPHTGALSQCWACLTPACGASRDPPRGSDACTSASSITAAACSPNAAVAGACSKFLSLT